MTEQHKHNHVLCTLSVLCSQFACQAKRRVTFPYCELPVNTFFDILQVLGTIIFGVGLWLAVDKHSLIALLKLVESERIEVSAHKQYQVKVAGETPQ